MNIKHCCTFCSKIHFSGFCPIYRMIVPDKDRMNIHECNSFSPIDPADLADRLEETEQSGLGSRLAALIDASIFLRGGTEPIRYLLPQTPETEYISTAVIDKIYSK